MLIFENALTGNVKDEFDFWKRVKLKHSYT